MSKKPNIVFIFADQQRANTMGYANDPVAITRDPLDLYDMQEDPQELHNRVDDPELGTVRDELIETTLARMLQDMDTSEMQNWQAVSDKDGKVLR